MAKQDEPTDAPEEEPSTQAQPTTVKPTKSKQVYGWNLGRVFWGLLLVIIGGLILANNFGWLSVNWDNLWRLWPLMIVAAGLSVLSIRNRAWRILTLLLVLLSLAAVVFVTTGPFAVSQNSQSYAATAQKLANITSADISLKAGMSYIDITSADQDAVAVAHLDSNTASNLSEQSSRNGNTQITNLTTDVGDHWWFGYMNSNLNLTLTRSLPLTLNLDVGPSETTADLSQAMLRSLNVKSGATKLNVTLGNKVDLTNVDIESGASAVVLRVPSSSGVRVKLDGGMLSSDMADLQNRNGTYESTGYDSMSKKIDVTAHLGMASFTVERY